MRILRLIIILILRLTHKRKNIAVIFQNDDDRNIFIDNNIVCENQVYKIKGSGVDLQILKYTPEPDDEKLCVLFVARMLREKGIYELIGAAKLLKDKYYHRVQFLLCGDIDDDNANSLSKIELESISDGEYIRWLGWRTDIQKMLENAHIFVLPSYYREGLPRVLIEACAIGRPVITTNSVGCRECVIDNYNGFLIPIKNSDVLAKRLELLIVNKDLRISMGKNAREFAENNFSVFTVVDKHIEIYNEVLR